MSNIFRKLSNDKSDLVEIPKNDIQKFLSKLINQFLIQNEEKYSSQELLARTFRLTQSRLS